MRMCHLGKSISITLFYLRSEIPANPSIFKILISLIKFLIFYYRQNSSDAETQNGRIK